MPTPVNVRKSEADLYCGRGNGSVPSTPGERGWLGNPVKTGKRCDVCGEVHREPGSTLECYRTYLERRLEEDPAFKEAFLTEIDEDTRLGCFCAPDPCHTDVIAEVWEDLTQDEPENKIYAGIGSRDTPEDVCKLMTRLAKGLAYNGWTLRSGAAEGADSAFEKGADQKEIYIPWDRFNNRDVHTRGHLLGGRSDEAQAIAAKHHPKWHALSQGARKLHARNVNQILGPDLETPVDRVLCWTPDGAEFENETSRKTGGTGQAIRIADDFDVPVHNLRLPSRRDPYEHWLQS